jgi:hypothetical protein
MLGQQEAKRKPLGFDTLIQPDGSIRFEDRSVRGAGLGISFDATDMLMRIANQDPYAVEKLRIARETREDRMKMATVYRARVTEEAIRQLPQRLQAIWSNRSLSLERRKQILFQLWSECRDDDAGRAARKQIVDFIRSESIEYPPETETLFFR